MSTRIPIECTVYDLPICSPREPVHMPEQRLAWALMVCGVNFQEVFARTVWGRFRRGRTVLVRQHVLWLCRQPSKNGFCPSFPESAHAIGVDSWSTIVEAVNRHTRALKAAGLIATRPAANPKVGIRANQLAVPGGAA